MVLVPAAAGEEPIKVAEGTPDQVAGQAEDLAKKIAKAGFPVLRLGKAKAAAGPASTTFGKFFGA